jgi:hypothetical protein
MSYATQVHGDLLRTAESLRVKKRPESVDNAANQDYTNGFDPYTAILMSRAAPRRGTATMVRSWMLGWMIQPVTAIQFLSIGTTVRRTQTRIRVEFNYL